MTEEATRRRAAPASAPASGRGGRRGGAVAAGAGHARGTRLRQPEVVFIAALCALATVAFGIYPDPLFDVARDAGAAITGLV